ncbi:MAG: CBS domain-containing protein [Proteobacteria bacterium]|nr:CBS domain-containing protein [Pseudomonadota bacterium]
MQIVTSHTNTDFDALASIVACTCLYPGAVGILPSHVMPNVKAFLAIHQDLLRIRPRKELDLENVSALIVVDANSWNRLDRMEVLSAKTSLDIICWDHHMEGVTIKGTREYREEVGATITLLVEEIARQDTPITPMQATLFLLGIYDDTGCLTFSSATHRDARMTAFLLENGADLNIVAAYLADTLDDSHSRVFSQMLANARTFEMEGLKIGICAQPVESGLTMLASLVSKYREFKGMDAVFGIFLTDQNKSMVIGRANPRSIDVGSVVRALGGGGHPAAGSAVVKGVDLETMVNRVVQLIHDAGQKEILVREIMSDPPRFVVDPSLTMEEARNIMAQEKLTALLVCDKGRILGSLSGETFAKAERSGRLDTSVKGFMKPGIRVAAPEDTARKALERMNRSDDGLLPVVEQGLLTGVLTRGNLILHLYDIQS